MKVVLIGAYGNGNIGDMYQAISIAAVLRGLRPDLDIHALSMTGRDLPYPSDGLKVVPRETLFDPAALNGFDLLLVGGGGLFASPHHPLHDAAWVSAIERPLCTVSLGATVPHSKNAAPFIKACAAFSVRDTYSLESVAPYRPDARITMDPILLAETLPGEIPPGQDKRDGVVWIPGKLLPGTKPFYADLMQRVFNPDIDIILSLNETSDRGSGFDELFGAHVRYAHTLAEVAAAMAHARFVVSERYHGCIFAIRGRRPCLALALRSPGVVSKVVGLYQWLGLSNCVFDMDARLRRKEMRELALAAFRPSAFRPPLAQEALRLRQYLADCLEIGDRHLRSPAG